jgi:hypothetical protein
MQVRLCELPQGAGSASVSKSLLGQHYSRAHKLALDPLCPAHCFYSCGEDGLVRTWTLHECRGLAWRVSTPQLACKGHLVPAWPHRLGSDLLLPPTTVNKLTHNKRLTSEL